MTGAGDAGGRECPAGEHAPQRPRAPRGARLRLGRRLLAAAALVAASAALSRGARADVSDWQGEWGAWERSGDRLIGGSIAIFDCAEEGAVCRLRFAGDAPGATCSAGQSAPLELRIAPTGRGLARLVGAGGAVKQCELALELGEGGGGSELRARLSGPDCGTFCVDHRVGFPERLPRVARLPFPMLSERECFADPRPVRRTWCVDPAVQRADAALAQRYDELAELSHQPRREDPMSAVGAAALDGCAAAADAASCLLGAYAKASSAADERLATARTSAAAEEAALSAPGDPAAGARLAAQIGGVYRRRFRNGLVDGSAYTSEDVLELAPVDGTRLYFRVHLEFYNGHECNESGVARFTRSGRFVFHGRPEDAIGGRPCRLQLAADASAIRILDPGDACQVGRCGMRGAFDGATFARAKRRPIRDLARLRASRAYRAALDAAPAP